MKSLPSLPTMTSSPSVPLIVPDPVTVAAENRVVPGAAGEIVVTGAAVELIVAGTAADRVVAGAGADLVVAAPTLDGVRAVAADDHVVAVGSDDRARARHRCGGAEAKRVLMSTLRGRHRDERRDSDEEHKRCQPTEHRFPLSSLNRPWQSEVRGREEPRKSSSRTSGGLKARGEQRAASGRALCAHLPAVGGDDLGDDGKPEARAGPLARASPAVEALEDVRQVGLLDAGAVVLDLERPAAQAHFDGPAGGAPLRGVVEQVRHRSAQRLARTEHRRRCELRVEADGWVLAPDAAERLLDDVV